MQFINSPRGDTEARISFDDLYRIVREKLNYFHPDRSDPDAFCQDMCVRIEKKMGIYPNVGAALATTAGEVSERLAKLERALTEINREATVANDVIRLNRDGDGQGRIRVATAMHRIAALAAALTKDTQP